MAAWKCEKCGSCCALVNCPFLTKDNLCSIYERRPGICRHEWVYNNLGFKETMTLDEFNDINKNLCRKFREIRST